MPNFKPNQEVIVHGLGDDLEHRGRIKGIAADLSGVHTAYIVELYSKPSILDYPEYDCHVFVSSVIREVVDEIEKWEDGRDLLKEIEEGIGQMNIETNKKG